MKVAKNWDDVETGKTTPEVINDPYIKAFADMLMDLSNDANDEHCNSRWVLNEYMPAIREFIANVTGL